MSPGTRESGIGSRPATRSGRPEPVDGSTQLTVDPEPAERVEGRESASNAHSVPRRRFVTGLILGLLGLWPGSRSAAQEGEEKNFTVVARKYTFAPGRLNVQQNDLVRITLTTEDIPHSFTVDKYRISKRVGPGQSVVFEFRADQPGRFPIYCNLTIDEKCRDMKGELVVNAR